MGYIIYKIYAKVRLLLDLLVYNMYWTYRFMTRKVFNLSKRNSVICVLVASSITHTSTLFANKVQWGAYNKGMTSWNSPSRIVLKNPKTIHALETHSHCNKSFVNWIQKWDTKMYLNVFTMKRHFMSRILIRYGYHFTRYFYNLISSGGYNILEVPRIGITICNSKHNVIQKYVLCSSTLQEWHM